MVLTKLDFPTPEFPVTPMFISTFFQPSSLALNILSIPDTPCSLICSGTPFACKVSYSERSSALLDALPIVLFCAAKLSYTTLTEFNASIVTKRCVQNQAVHVVDTVAVAAKREFGKT